MGCTPTCRGMVLRIARSGTATGVHSRSAAFIPTRPTTGADLDTWVRGILEASPEPRKLPQPPLPRPRFPTDSPARRTHTPRLLHLIEGLAGAWAPAGFPAATVGTAVAQPAATRA